MYISANNPITSPKATSTKRPQNNPVTLPQFDPFMNPNMLVTINSRLGTTKDCPLTNDK